MKRKNIQHIYIISIALSRYRLGLILKVELILKSFWKFRLGLIFGETR